MIAPTFRVIIAILTPFLLVLGPVALLVAMGIVFAETGLLVGFFLPGDSLLFTLGVLAAGGLLHLPFWLVAAGLLLAAVAGDQVGYLLGRRFGPQVFSRTESRFFSRSHAERGQAFFAKHEPKRWCWPGSYPWSELSPRWSPASPACPGVASPPTTSSAPSSGPPDC